MSGPRVVVTMAALVPTLLSSAVMARADSVAVTRITGASPFPASCPAAYPFPDAEAEFTLGANPQRPSQIAAAWLQGPLGSTVAGKIGRAHV